MPGTPPNSVSWLATSSERTTGGMITLQISSKKSSSERHSGMRSDEA
jgi:hypothetical protein